jgi:hypothetical protein
MKSNRLFIIIAFSLPHLVALAQRIPTFESLKLNSAPSFVILGVEPENISRPASPTQFVGAIQNSVVNGQLQPNFALEFTPYYFKNPRKDPERFKALNYLLPSQNVGNTIGRTFSVSLATSESDSVAYGNLAAGTGLGLGIRFTLYEGATY